MEQFMKEFAFNHELTVYRKHISVVRVIIGVILMILLPFPMEKYRCKIWTHEFIRVCTNYKSCLQLNSMTCQHCPKVYFFWW